MLEWIGPGLRRIHRVDYGFHPTPFTQIKSWNLKYVAVTGTFLGHLATMARKSSGYMLAFTAGQQIKWLNSARMWDRTAKLVDSITQAKPAFLNNWSFYPKWHNTNQGFTEQRTFKQTPKSCAWVSQPKKAHNIIPQGQHFIVMLSKCHQNLPTISFILAFLDI